MQWHGNAALTLTYRDDAGHVGEQLLYRVDEPGLTWAARPRLVPHRRRRALPPRQRGAPHQLAYLFDPLLAVSTSNVMPLPHQISAVYEEMLSRQPLHFLLADDPGAGKTIMAGLLIKELMVRGDAKRVLIVCPGMLVDQWQDELREKFHLPFEIVTRQMIDASSAGNPFLEKDLLIARLDHLSRNEELLAKLSQSDWDLVICDEAHKMSAHYFGNEVKETKRYKLGMRLGEVTRHLLLMTATPHSGKPEDFDLFMALLDYDRFAGKVRGKKGQSKEAGARDMMRRLSKEQLRHMDGRPLFPERRAYAVKYALSADEAYLYNEVTTYVREEMNRADRLANEQGEGRRRIAVGFALTTLQRRLASSPEAIYQSLKRRRKRLEAKLEEEKLLRRGAQVTAEQADVLLATGAVDPEFDIEDLEDLDELPDEELEELEEQVVDQASAAQTIQELQYEIVTLTHLEELADKVRISGCDKKWEQLSGLLQDDGQTFDVNGERCADLRIHLPLLLNGVEEPMTFPGATDLRRVWWVVENQAAELEPADVSLRRPFGRLPKAHACIVSPRIKGGPLDVDNPSTGVDAEGPCLSRRSDPAPRGSAKPSATRTGSTSLRVTDLYRRRTSSTMTHRGT